MHADPTPGPAAELVTRLQGAVNDHDLDALVACFAADYRNETPAHPARGFVGREQVRRNWGQILGAVPDLVADLRMIADDSTAWTEWEMRGTRVDGSPHLMRGVVIFEVRDREASAARFYLEPVEAGGPEIDQAVRQAVGRA
jgi:ketosteroid isomerase-like protein